VGLGLDALGEAFRAGALDIKHAGMLVPGLLPGDPVRLAQAMPHGAEIVDLDPAKHWTEKCAYVRLPEDYPGQALDAAMIATLMVREGVDYGFLSYPALAAYKFGVRNERLRNWINRRRDPVIVDWPSGRRKEATVALPVEAICSVFNDQCETLAGKDLVDNTHPQAVTPGKLADVLSTYDGAVWARPRGINLPARTWRINGEGDYF